MKLQSNIGLLLLAGLLLSGCGRKKNTEEQRLSWSTESPLSIPYHTRFQRFDKKNLLRNPSFETGKTFKLDSTKTSFVIDGWKQTGKNVEWVDTRKDSIFDRREALSGYRAVKITRKQAYETDKEGEGVLSDFIKVIPGNYSFSFYTRLENIRPVKGRLGIKMYDAVDVRLLFFDKSKNAISPEHPFQQLHQVIDNSFKSLSLANFTEIPTFGWGKIIGKSADFPFPDGDIPTSAHYVKIFLGLKGTGTMWIDSVSFSYTTRNFSVGERMMGYTDTAFQVQPIIIPTPKSLERMESVIFSSPGEPDRLPVIIIPAQAEPLIRQAADLLRNALSESASTTGSKDPDIPIITADGIQQLNGERLTFILGPAGQFEKCCKGFPLAEIQGHPQGYYIYSSPGLPHVVFLNGNNAIGVYYAVLSALQLIDNHQPIFHNAQVVDYPDFEYRYYTQGKIIDDAAAEHHASQARQLESCKLNGAFYKLRDSRDYAPGSPLQTFREMIVRPGIFNLAGIGSDGSEGARHFFSGLVYTREVLMPDDSSMYYPFHADLNRFKDCNSPDGKEVFKGSTSGPGSYSLYPVYNNQLLDLYQYTGHAGESIAGSACFYSGSSFFSLNTDDADFERFLAFVKRKPVFMDNSMLASSVWGHYNGASPYYPGKIRLFNIFEPFNNTGIRDHFNHLDSSLFWVNTFADSELDVIRLSTAADFMWNARTYDPDLSLWNVLVSRYGVNAARNLIYFADQYGLLLEIELKLSGNEPLPRNLKNVQAVLSNLASTGDRLGQFLGPGHPLMKELLSLYASLKTRVNRYIKTNTANP